METHVLESTCFFQKSQVTLVLWSQVDDGPVRTNGELKSTFEWSLYLIYVDINPSSDRLIRRPSVR